MLAFVNGFLGLLRALSAVLGGHEVSEEMY